jgi:hypothetical protein
MEVNGETGHAPNVPPTLRPLSTSASSGGYTSLKTCCAALLKHKIAEERGPTRKSPGAISPHRGKAFYRLNAESIDGAQARREIQP